MKPIIKKIKNGLKILTINLLMVGTILSTTSCSNPAFENFNSDDDIVSISEKMDCDISYLKQHRGNYVRMQHNEDEPIYVYLDSVLTEDEKQSAIRALDYVFGIVGRINSKYRYEIVDKAEFDSKINKTKIDFSLGKMVSFEYGGEEHYAQAHIDSRVSALSGLTDQPGMKRFSIRIDRDELADQTQESKDYTNIHELLHGFGKSDVYFIEALSNVDRLYGNTIMNSDEGAKFKYLTPNDVKCLILLYAEKDADKKQLKSILSEYTEQFYDHYTKSCIEKAEIDDVLDREDFGFETKISVTDVDGTKFGYIYNIEVEDGRYLFTMYDLYTNQEIDRCEGKVLNRNGVMILRDVELKKGFRPYEETTRYEDGLIQDLVLAKKKGNIMMYDFLTNDGRIGDTYELEKNIVQ